MTKKQKQNFIKGIITVICLGLLALFWFVIKPMLAPTYEVPEGTAEFHFIDVGQGDATLIKVGDKNILIDTGEKSEEQALLSYLDSHGVVSIEYFVITHFDSDHFGNGVKVLEAYDVKNLLIPDQVKTTKTYEKFIEKAQEQKDKGDIEILNANTMIEEKITVNSLELTVLAPLKNNYKDSNDYSVVLMARYGNKRVLLTGDAEKEAEADIVERYNASDLDCDVYKLGHHGSRTSSSKELLQYSTPEYAIISCGVDNDYGHPHKEALDRVSGMQIYRTDIQGTVVLSIANDVISVTTEK